jgi:glutamate-1-semialdehyde 2,1-aminomutase
MYLDSTPKSRSLFEKARKYLPGGVSYGLRYFSPYPFYVVKAKGSRVWDVDGNEYLDFWMGHGAIVTGHNYEPIIKAVREQLEYGAHFGWCNEWEVKWAEAVCRWFDMDMVRPSNSGTESNMYAVRLARTYTGRVKVGKFEGGWHGGYDGLHRGVSYPYDKPSSSGLTESATRDIVLLPYNDLDGVRERVKGEDLACIIVEPVMGAAGFIPAEKEFLKGLRELCSEKGILLILDEVITGFRFYKGGQNYYNVKPDLITTGKAVGGQYFPGAGAICGRAEIMEKLDQIKIPNFWERSFHGGTYVGNALTMRAGYTLIRELEDKSSQFFPYLDRLGEKVINGLNNIFARNSFEAYTTGLGSLFAIHFTREKPVNGLTAERTKNRELNRKLFEFMLNHGVVYSSPSTAHFVFSIAHTEEDINRFLALAEEFVRGVRA